MLWEFTYSKDTVGQDWITYRGNRLPEEESENYQLLDVPANPGLNQIAFDVNGSTNKTFNFFHSGEEKYRWRHKINPEDTAITIVSKVADLGPDKLCICYFEIKGFGFREKLRINQNTFKLEKATPVIEEEPPFTWNEEYHLVRIVMNRNKVTLFLDEEEEPFMEGITLEENSTNYFEWGKAGSNSCGGSIDWISILENQAVPPGEGPEFPRDLFLSSDANLNSIEINGERINDFLTDQYDYEVFLEDISEIPLITFETRSKFASADLFSYSSDEFLIVEIIVTAHDLHTQNKYIIRFLENSTKTAETNESRIKIFPNPSDRKLIIKDLDEQNGRIELFNPSGQKVLEKEYKKGIEIDVSFLPSGLYLINIKNEKGLIFMDKVIINH